MDNKEVSFYDLKVKNILINNLIWIPFLTVAFLISKEFFIKGNGEAITLTSSILLTLLLSIFAIIWVFIIKIGDKFTINLFSFICIILFNISLFLHYGIIAAVIAIIVYCFRYFLTNAKVENQKVVKEMYSKNKKKNKKKRK